MPIYFGTDPHYPEGGGVPTGGGDLPSVGEIWGGGYMPRPRYEPAYWERWRDLETARPQTDWFESMFGTMLRRFKAKQPTQKGYETLEEAEKRTAEIEKTWAEHLRGKELAMREEFWSYRPTSAQRKERPSTFAPILRSVKF